MRLRMPPAGRKLYYPNAPEQLHQSRSSQGTSATAVSELTDTPFAYSLIFLPSLALPLHVNSIGSDRLEARR